MWITTITLLLSMKSLLLLLWWGGAAFYSLLSFSHFYFPTFPFTHYLTNNTTNNNSGMTPLHVAAANGCTSVCLYLISRFKELANKKDKMGRYRSIFLSLFFFLHHLFIFFSFQVPHSLRNYVLFPREGSGSRRRLRPRQCFR